MNLSFGFESNLNLEILKNKKMRNVRRQIEDLNSERGAFFYFRISMKIILNGKT